MSKDDTQTTSDAAPAEVDDFLGDDFFDTPPAPQGASAADKPADAAPSSDGGEFGEGDGEGFCDGEPGADDTSDGDGESEESSASAADDQAKDADEASADDGAFSAELLQRAAAAGFDKEQAERFGTPENLEISLTAQDRRLAALGGSTDAGDRDVGGAARKTGDDTPPAANSAPADKKPAAAADAPTATEFSIPDEVREQLEPDVAKLFDAMAESFNVRMEAMQGHVGEIVEARDAQVEADTARETEGYFETASEALFGKGAGEKLDQAGAEYGNRVKLCTAAGKLARGIVKTDGRAALPPVRELLDRAYRLEFPDHMKSKAREEVQGAVDKAKRRSSLKPTGRRTNRHRDPDRDALDAIGEKLDSFGLSD